MKSADDLDHAARWRSTDTLPPNTGGYSATSFQLVGQTPEGKLVSHLTGECVLRHLGPTTLEAWQFITSKHGCLELDDCATFTADNGDTLQANFKGIAEYTSYWDRCGGYAGY